MWNFIKSLFKPRAELAFENLALRQQLALIGIGGRVGGENLVRTEIIQVFRAT